AAPKLVLSGPICARVRCTTPRMHWRALFASVRTSLVQHTSSNLHQAGSSAREKRTARTCLALEKGMPQIQLGFAPSERGSRGLRSFPSCQDSRSKASLQAGEFLARSDQCGQFLDANSSTFRIARRVPGFPIFDM